VSQCGLLIQFYCCIDIILTRVRINDNGDDDNDDDDDEKVCMRNMVNWSLTKNNLQMKFNAVSCTVWLKTHVDAVVAWRGIVNGQYALSGR